ncbi:MAG: hypothetical protein JSR46_09835, partial [Verrucomicrobia bacterium]|nr:hypothetical protein [Verrucomicrobiota bacterium]
PTTVLGPAQIAQLANCAFYGQRATEGIVEKAKKHPGNIVQLYPEGISLMNFAPGNHQADRVVLTANESTTLQVQQRDKTVPYSGKKVEIVDLKMDRYLEALAFEIGSYQGELDDERFEQDCTIQFLSQKILATLATLKEKAKYRYTADEAILAAKIKKFEKRRSLLQNRDSRIQNIINDQKKLEKLHALMLEGRAKEFMVLFSGVLTAVIELSFVPLESAGGKTVLQLAIQMGNVALFEEMLKAIEIAYKHRLEQKKPSKQDQSFSDLLNRANGGLLRTLLEAPVDQDKKLQMMDLLVQHADCSPGDEQPDGLTSLHLAVKDSNHTLFSKLTEKATGGNLYRRTYKSSDVYESLFEYTLHTASPEFLLKIL